MYSDRSANITENRNIMPESCSDSVVHPDATSGFSKYTVTTQTAQMLERILDTKLTMLTTRRGTAPMLIRRPTALAARCANERCPDETGERPYASGIVWAGKPRPAVRAFKSNSAFGLESICRIASRVR